MKHSVLISLSLAIVIVAGLILRSPSSKTEAKLAANACNTQNLGGVFNAEETYGIFEGQQFNLNSLALTPSENEKYVLSAASDERWVEVDLSEQKLYAWEGDKLFLETSVSTGLPGTPTPKGEFRIWIKLRATKMEGGQGRYYYYLPNVPYVMYFFNTQVPAYKGYGLHGTYWHNDFGTPRSHGCVNLPTEIAKSLYYWTGPYLSEGKYTAYASDENKGTRIIIHD